MSSTLRIVDDVIELDRQRVARLLPKLAPTLAYRLVEAFDDADDSADHVLYLESQIEDLKKQVAKLKAQARR
jgi:polyhydroxyalkanoate synthesis regulator phasin